MSRGAASAAASALARVEGANDASGRSSPSSSSSGESSDTPRRRRRESSSLPREDISSASARASRMGFVSSTATRTSLDSHRPASPSAASATRRNTRSSGARIRAETRPLARTSVARRARRDGLAQMNEARARGLRAHRAQARLEKRGRRRVAVEAAETPSQRVRDVVEVGLQKTPDGVDGGRAFVRRLSKGGRVVVSRRPLGVRLGERLERGPRAVADARVGVAELLQQRAQRRGDHREPGAGARGPRARRAYPRALDQERRQRRAAAPIDDGGRRRRFPASAFVFVFVFVFVFARARVGGARDRPERRGEVLVQHETRRAARRVPGRASGGRRRREYVGVARRLESNRLEPRLRLLGGVGGASERLVDRRRARARAADPVVVRATTRAMTRAIGAFERFVRGQVRVRRGVAKRGDAVGDEGVERAGVRTKPTGDERHLRVHLGVGEVREPGRTPRKAKFRFRVRFWFRGCGGGGGGGGGRLVRRRRLSRWGRGGVVRGRRVRIREKAVVSPPAFAFASVSFGPASLGRAPPLASNAKHASTPATAALRVRCRVSNAAVVRSAPIASIAASARARCVDGGGGARPDRPRQSDERVLERGSRHVQIQANRRNRSFFRVPRGLLVRGFH